MTARRATILHMSDLHFGGIVPGSVEALLEAVERLSPTLVVISGDFTLKGARQEFRDASEFVRRISRPVLAVPGNHDISAYRMLERFLRPLRRYEHHIRPETVDRYEGDGLAVLGVNSARSFGWHWNWSHGRLSLAQLFEIERFFAAHKEAPLRCLVAHHPPIVPDDMPGYRAVGKARLLRELLRRRRIDLVLCGHLHRAFYAIDGDGGRGADGDGREPAGPIIVNASTATSPRTRIHANGFNLIALEDSRLEIEHWQRPGSGEFVRGAVRRFQRAEADGPDTPGWRVSERGEALRSASQSAGGVGAAEHGSIDGDGDRGEVVASRDGARVVYDPGVVEVASS
ncbi:MAG: metallophosphoesterase family protein [Phycisphaerales bacterium]